MSSIGEARQHVAAASELANEAKSALVSANEAIGQAIDVFAQAAAGSSHTKITSVLGAYRSAMVEFEEAMKRLSDGQSDANSYAAALG